MDNRISRFSCREKGNGVLIEGTASADSTNMNNEGNSLAGAPDRHEKPQRGLDKPSVDERNELRIPVRKTGIGMPWPLTPSVKLAIRSNHVYIATRL
jgi:hypothetical protein